MFMSLHKRAVCCLLALLTGTLLGVSQAVAQPAMPPLAEPPAAAEEPAAAPDAAPTVTLQPAPAPAAPTPAPAAAPAVPAAVDPAVPAPTVTAPPAEEAGEAAAAVPDSEETVELETEGLTIPGVLVRASDTNAGLISITLDDVPLQDVVRMFTRISGANIIATATNLQGRVTVNLQDVEWKPALNSILDMHKLQLSEKAPGSGIYSITPVQPGAPEPRVSETIFLTYASVSGVVTVATRLVGDQGTVSPYAVGNALVIQAPAATIMEVRRVVREIDVPRNQVFIEAKFVELSDQAIKDLGINWQVLEGYSVGLRGMQASWQENFDKTKSRTDRSIQSDSRSRVDEINERFDINGNQYEESTTTIEEQPPGSGNFVANTVVTPTRNITDGIDQSLNVSRELQDSAIRSLSQVRTAILGVDDFALVLSALKQTDGISIVSNPKIIVANEQSATIKIADEEPNIKVTRERSTVQGQPELVTSELDPTRPYFTYGITVEVTPTINTSSNITVRIKPELSRFVRDKVAPDGNTFPVTATKTIETVFSMESGRTAAIGGLTETVDRDVETKVPLLGDIPLIGKYLFSHSSRQKNQKETIIFVTVGLANPYSMGANTGLPETSDLIHRHLLRSSQAEAEKSQRAEELKEAVSADLPAKR
jgi:type II secretory pathway component GspD/PulD (secretin)